MTKTIDTNYIMDEVTILGQLVEKLLSRTALVRGNPDPLTVREMEINESMREELRERRATRQRMPAGLAEAHEVVEQAPRISEYQLLEENIEALRTMPSQSAMRAILTSHRISKLAAEMGFEAVFLKAFTKQGGRGVVAGLTDEDQDKFFDDMKSNIPQNVYQTWNAAVRGVRAEMQETGAEELIPLYAEYLDWVLSKLAQDPAIRRDTGLWSYSSEIRDVTNVEFTPQELKDRVQDTDQNYAVPKRDPIFRFNNHYYKIDIEFTPTVMLNHTVLTRIGSSLVFEDHGHVLVVKDRAPNGLHGTHERFGEIHRIAYEALGHKNYLVAAMGTDPTRFLAYGVGSCRLEALVHTAAQLVKRTIVEDVEKERLIHGMTNLPQAIPAKETRDRVDRTIQEIEAEGVERLDIPFKEVSYPKSAVDKEFARRDEVEKYEEKGYIAKSTGDLMREAFDKASSPVKIEHIEATSRKLDKTWRAEPVMGGTHPSVAEIEKIINESADQYRPIMDHDEKLPSYHIERHKIFVVIETAMEKMSNSQLQSLAGVLTATSPESYRILITSRDQRKALWTFDSEAQWRERRGLIEAMQRLRWPEAGFVESSERRIHYLVPLTFEELSVVFGPMEEQT